MSPKGRPVYIVRKITICTYTRLNCLFAGWFFFEKGESSHECNEEVCDSF